MQHEKKQLMYQQTSDTSTEAQHGFVGPIHMRVRSNCRARPIWNDGGRSATKQADHCVTISFCANVSTCPGHASTTRSGQTPHTHFPPLTAHTHKTRFRSNHDSIGYDTVESNFLDNLDPFGNSRAS